ncbi:YciI family protein [Petrimonas mucosa]|jgi:uncharacterized protein YciI|uniref:YciI family protein n=1 Tax=Petrimonas mucosa TaxID=1642646 RepID=UPI0023F07C1F|nr:YciI family protein [Petrimonas mucosa]MDD3559857.1 YciI family protein [Petrimonas mucosa]
MKSILSFFILFLALTYPAFASFHSVLQERGKKAKAETTTVNPAYDAALAKKLGADDYGMKSFVLVILKTGPNTTADAALVSECFRGHMENINRLVKEGKLVVAGPLAKNEQHYRGIFILSVDTTEEAEKLLESDPAVREKLLAADLYQWYGSAALPLYLEQADKIWKKQP